MQCQMNPIAIDSEDLWFCRVDVLHWEPDIYDKQRVAAARLQSEASSPFLPSRVLEIPSS